MEQLQFLVDVEPKEMIACLPRYQAKLVEELLSQGNDYLDIADKWLSSRPANTVGFGGTQNDPVIYREVLLNELEKFLCGDKKYKEDRTTIGTSIQVGVGAVAASIGNTLGVAGPYILPVIVVLLINIGRIPLDAFCELRKKGRKKD